MGNNWQAVQQADEIYRRAPGDKADLRTKSIQVLGSHGLWSLAQIAAITGSGMHDVRRVVEKKDRTGGRLNPDTLTLVLEEFRIRDLGQTNDVLTYRIVNAGTSPVMLARLLGVEISAIRGQVRRGAKGVGDG